MRQTCLAAASALVLLLSLQYVEAARSLLKGPPTAPGPAPGPSPAPPPTSTNAGLLTAPPPQPASRPPVLTGVTQPNLTTYIPPSPYTVNPVTGLVDPQFFCQGDGVVVATFPSSPFPINVFSPLNKFENPPAPKNTIQKGATDDYGYSYDAYEIEIKDYQNNFNVGCEKNSSGGQGTWMIGYDSHNPGPTITTDLGTQVMVRFKNNIENKSGLFPVYKPCDQPGRGGGHPMSIHHHGSASMAPYDGWAEDETCTGEYKDYLYPANRPATQWYHDHAIDITGNNVYYGVSGLFVVKEKDDQGLDRWGLTNMTDVQLVLADKVFKSDCQLLLDTAVAHAINLYGDVNLVSGKPFPVMDFENKWYRFRVVNSAAGRPWLLHIVDWTQTPISDLKCWVIAGDGGYRKGPIRFPANGLFVGVAERYEFACDFSGMGNTTLYLWNHYDPNRMPGVPFFCNSHLLAKLNVVEGCTGNCTKDGVVLTTTATFPTTIDREVLPAEYNTALTMANSNICDRNFLFGRSGGEWVINGQTWYTNRVAADNIGTNSWELWCLEAGGGWFHPVHIHLIDFYVMKRYNAGQFPWLQDFESDVPKDVVQVHQGARLALLARWGPHRGEYMFHCHNLRHEDNAMLRTFRTNASATTVPAQLRAPESYQANVTALEFTSTAATFTFLQSTTVDGSKTLYDFYQDPRLPKASAQNMTTAIIFDQASNYTSAKAALANLMTQEIHRIFYPGHSDRDIFCNETLNPWLVRKCGPNVQGSTPGLLLDQPTA